MTLTASTRVPKGQIVFPTSGDLIFVKRKRLLDMIIRAGEFIRFGRDTWSHVAVITDSKGTLVECIARGCIQDNIEKYQGAEYLIVHTSTSCLHDEEDVLQAIEYAKTQVGRSYGWMTVLGTATRFLTPGHGFAFIGQANICSGLAAQFLTRGRFTPQIQPVTMSPTELAEALGVDTK